VAVNRVINSIDYKTLSKKTEIWTCLRNEPTDSFKNRLEASTRGMDKDC